MKGMGSDNALLFLHRLVAARLRGKFEFFKLIKKMVFLNIWAVLKLNKQIC